MLSQFAIQIKMGRSYPIQTICEIISQRIDALKDQCVTCRETVAVSLLLPPVPVTVMVYVPIELFESAVTVMVEVPEPGAAMDMGLKVTVTPFGWPAADKITAVSKPPEFGVVMVLVRREPLETESEVGEADMLKAGGAFITASALIRADPLGLPQPVTRS